MECNCEQVDILKALDNNMSSSFKDDELARSFAGYSSPCALTALFSHSFPRVQAAWTTGVVRIASAAKPKNASGYHATKAQKELERVFPCF